MIISKVFLWVLEDNHSARSQIVGRIIRNGGTPFCSCDFTKIAIEISLS